MDALKVKNDIIEENVNKLRRKKAVILYRVLGIISMVAFCVFLYAAFKLIGIGQEYKSGNDEYNDLHKFISMIPESKDQSIGTDIPKVKVPIDFDSLYVINSDIVGWIYFENIDINYPIVKGIDNSFYLKYTFKKQQNSCGSIFVDCDNNKDFSDLHTLIYGHNMRNGSMFAILKKYEKKEFFDQNPYFWIYTSNSANKYEIFSCYIADAASESYNKKFVSTEEYRQFLDMAINNSLYRTGVPVSEKDLVVSLSTCTGGERGNRFIVHGKRVIQ